MKKENNERVRWLEEEEEAALRAVIREKSPEREPEFDLALHTGMRWSEQLPQTALGEREHAYGREHRNWWKAALKESKVQDFHWHDIRHTFASRLAMEGVNDATLQTLGRWKEPKMIRRYAYLSQQHLAEAIERIGAHSTTLFTTSKAGSL